MAQYVVNAAFLHGRNPVLRGFIADAARLVDGSLDIRRFKLVSE
jgi:hypothetical protein